MHLTCVREFKETDLLVVVGFRPAEPVLTGEVSRGPPGLQGRQLPHLSLARSRRNTGREGAMHDGQDGLPVGLE
jgi:hypothetical protein